jgi:hypothetical protein
MNYFAHAYRHLDDPYFAAGTAVPDWLSVVDRRVRVRSKHLGPLEDDPDPRVAALGRGMRQHFADDDRFHRTRAFAETSLALTVAVRDALADESGLRPYFVGHLLVEVLLDASLIAEHPSRLDAYYAALADVDRQLVQAAVNRVASRPTERLATMISEFCRARILSDYHVDAKLWVRLNQVMRRVSLPELGEPFLAILPHARRLVDRERPGLLEDTGDNRCATG